MVVRRIKMRSAANYIFAEPGELRDCNPFHVRQSVKMQPLGEGARQSRRMDAALPLAVSDVCCLIV